MKKLDKIKNSSAYAKAKNSAEDTLKNPGKLKRLISDLEKKISGKLPDAFKGIQDSLLASIRMIKAYANGEYKQTPWQSLLLIVAALAYFVMPMDVVPDFILGLGLLDDASLLIWALGVVKKDINAFLDWEKTRGDS